MPRLHPDSRLNIARADVALLCVSLSTWSKIDAMFKLGQDRLTEMSLAFDYAVDEMLNSHDPRYGKLTERASVRQYRQDRLRRVIAQVGANRAAFLFAVEEVHLPDLLDPAIQNALVIDGTRAYVLKSRLRRLKIQEFSLQDFTPQDTNMRVPRLSLDELAMKILEDRDFYQNLVKKKRLVDDATKAAKAKADRQRKDRHNENRRKYRKEGRVLKEAFAKSDFIRLSTTIKSRRTPKRDDNS